MVDHAIHDEQCEEDWRHDRSCKHQGPSEWTDEQVRKLPYGDPAHPATLSDITKELTNLVVMVSGLMHVVGDPSKVLEMIESGPKDVRIGVAVAQTRFGLALDSYLSADTIDMIESLSVPIAEIIGRSFPPMHDAAHGRPGPYTDPSEPAEPSYPNIPPHLRERAERARRAAAEQAEERAKGAQDLDG